MMHAGRLVVMLGVGWLALRAALILARAKAGTKTPIRDAHDPDWL